MTNGEVIIVACTSISLMAAVSAFSCWRLAKHAEDETVALFHKFCDVLEKTSDNGSNSDG